MRLSSRACSDGQRLCEGCTTVTAAEVLVFVDTHGVVLESASGPVPLLVTALVGEPIRGSWWGHPQSHQVFTDHPGGSGVRVGSGLPARQWKGNAGASPAVARAGSCCRPVFGSALGQDQGDSRACWSPPGRGNTVPRLGLTGSPDGRGGAVGERGTARAWSMGTPSVVNPQGHRLVVGERVRSLCALSDEATAHGLVRNQAWSSSRDPCR